MEHMFPWKCLRHFGATSIRINNTEGPWVVFSWCPRGTLQLTPGHRQDPVRTSISCRWPRAGTSARLSTKLCPGLAWARARDVGSPPQCPQVKFRSLDAPVLLRDVGEPCQRSCFYTTLADGSKVLLSPGFRPDHFSELCPYSCGDVTTTRGRDPRGRPRPPAEVISGSHMGAPSKQTAPQRCVSGRAMMSRPGRTRRATRRHGLRANAGSSVHPRPLGPEAHLC